MGLEGFSLCVAASVVWVYSGSEAGVSSSFSPASTTGLQNKKQHPGQ